MNWGKRKHAFRMRGLDEFEKTMGETPLAKRKALNNATIAL